MDDRNNPYGSGRGQYDQSNDGDYGRDYGSGRDYTYSSARDYAAAGEFGGGRGRYGGREQRDYRDDWNRNRPDWRSQGYSQQDLGARGYGYGESRGQGESRNVYGANRDSGFGGYGNYGGYSGEERGGGYRGQQGRGYGERGGWNERGSSNYDRDRGGDRNRQGRMAGYDEDRGFFERAGDEVRSWFGDEEAERRRRMDQRYDEMQARDENRNHPDSHYNSWRRSRIAEFDRDYDEYRRENAQRFHNEFESWRTERSGQRDALRRVNEHMEVVGSDDAHVGTVDKVRGDRIILTKNDTDAEGRHHSIPSRWIDRVEDDKVHLRKTAEEAQNHWRDEERSGALFGENGPGNTTTGAGNTTGGNRDQDDRNWRSDRNLNRSFSGTY